MYPFNINPLGFPFGVLSPGMGPVIRRRSCLKQLKIFELPTNSVVLSDTSVDYGINPRVYNELPCECYISIKIRQAVPTGGDALPVNVIVPSGSSTSTVSNSGTTGTKKAPVVDHDNTQVTGSDMNEFTDVLALLNKSIGVIKLVNFRTGGTSSNTPAGGNTPAESAVKSK